MRLAYVVHRYGPEIKGGSETHCRLLAERVAARGISVEAFTTCALDYVSWENQLPEGESSYKDVRIRRFPVVRPRGHAFHRLSDQILPNPSVAPIDLQLEWARLQGPEVPSLVETLRSELERFDLVVFFTYLYYTTLFGLPAVSEKAVLHPTAHDEPPIHLSIYERVFKAPRAFIFNTEEERDFLAGRFGISHVPHIVMGAGIDPPADLHPERFRSRTGTDGGFLLYLGRLDEAKGCEHLCEWFIAYKNRRPGPLKLFLAGEKVYVPPDHPDIVYLGILEEEEKWDALAAADLVVVPSFYESLSMVLLEAWSAGSPALVNGKCEVLVGHCRRSGGGVWYESYGEFEAALDRLMQDPSTRALLAHRGRSYAVEHYGWDALVDTYLEFLREIA